VFAPPGTTDTDRLRALAAAIRRYAISLEAAGSLVVVTTPSGYANALAQAVDEAAHPGIVGTVAGDNTILVVARDGTPAAVLRDELAGHALEGAA
jgi:transcriptional regulator of arginine metabolism